VLKSRLRNEYELDADLEASPYDVARWISGPEADVEKFISVYRSQMAEDRDAAPVFLAKSNWELGYVADKFPTLRFARTRERADVQAQG
jgi:peptide chain release factor 3